MVKDIEAAFTDIVAELQWMDTETKNRTLDKVRAMRPFIGFPGWLLTPGQLEHYFQGVCTTELKNTRLQRGVIFPLLWIFIVLGFNINNNLKNGKIHNGGGIPQ